MKDAVQRFWEKVDKGSPDDCWLWQGDDNGSGYGKFYLDGKPAYAHRFSYEQAHGAISNGMFVCHKCDNPRCVNPSHLFLGTHDDNMRDMAAKERHFSKTRPELYRVGEDHQGAKLSEAQVREIRRRYAAGDTTHRQLAKEFGVEKSTVGRIVLGIIWRHVTDEVSDVAF